MYKATFSVLAVMVIFTLASHIKAEEHIVKMVSDWDNGTYYFEPKDITIKSGDTVTWINVQDDMHNAVTDSIPKGADPFESPMLEEEDQKWSHTFTTPGTYSYHCHPHAEMGMKGTVIVDRPSKPEEMQDGGHGQHDHSKH